jgi:hypothetical protein
MTVHFGIKLYNDQRNAQVFSLLYLFTLQLICSYYANSTTQPQLLRQQHNSAAVTMPTAQLSRSYYANSTTQPQYAISAHNYLPCTPLQTS